MTLRTTSDGPLHLLTLDEPRRANPLSAGLADALIAELERVADDDGVRAVILTGAGRHFSAGADLAALERIASGGDPDEQLADSRRLERLYAALLSSPQLTVAAVHGAAIGGGCGLATACDLVVAEHAARFSYTETRLGFVPALVSTFLVRRVPGHVARRLLLDPEILDGRTAAKLGLVDELVPDGAAVGRAREIALAVARKTAPSAVAATKRLLLETAELPWREALARAAEVNAEQRLHPDCRRGVRSFLDTKATPDWLEEG